jgi:hypothetical protein
VCACGHRLDQHTVSHYPHYREPCRACLHCGKRSGPQGCCDNQRCCPCPNHTPEDLPMLDFEVTP